MNIAFFEVMKEEEEFLRNKLNGFSVSYFNETLSLINAKKFRDLESVSVFIYSKIDKEVLDKMPRLKFISTRSTGFDHIDIEECKKRGIRVCNVPHYGENTVAEFTFALILSLTRKMNIAFGKVGKMDFSIEGLKGMDLKNKTLGVIGTGRIGANVIKIAKSFDMKIIAYDIYQNSELEKNMGFEYVKLPDLLKKSDIITLHTSYSKESHHMLDKKAFSIMKNGVFIINTTRGGLIDSKSMIEYVNNGKIGGVALDVFEDEYKLKNSEGVGKVKKTLFSDKIILTPHIAFYTKEAVERINEKTISNMVSFAGKKQLDKDSVVC